MSVENAFRDLLKARAQRLDAGGRALGWKVGFGSEEARNRLGLDGPLVGYLLDEWRLDHGATCSLSGWTNPLLEPEIAVYLERDVPSADALDGAIGALGAAIELVDIHPPPNDPQLMLAGNIFHRHVLLAPPNPSCTTPAAVTARVSRDGEEVAATDEPEALNGTVAANVGHVADVLAAAGERLRAGDVVIAGSVVAAQPVAPGQRWRVELPPLGAIDVAFE